MPEEWTTSMKIQNVVSGVSIIVPPSIEENVTKHRLLEPMMRKQTGCRPEDRLSEDSDNERSRS